MSRILAGGPIAARWLLNRRWWLVIMAGVGIMIFESVEYFPFATGVGREFVFEVIFYGIFVPASIGLSLSALATSRSELAWSTYSHSLKRNLDLQLNAAKTEEELAGIYLQFVRMLAPLAAVTLYRFEPRRRQYQTILRWSSIEELASSEAAGECSHASCPLLPTQTAEGKIAPQTCHGGTDGSSGTNACLCMPFWFSNALVAAARMCFSSENGTSPQQLRLVLEEVAPGFAAAFHRIGLLESMKRKDDTVHAEQVSIAREVHDSLGQNLAVLRLKLEQISMHFDQGEMDSLRKEVESLRDIAKEAYGQMRDMLNMLSPDEYTDISSTLLKYADRVGQRAPFELRVHQSGKPHPSLSAIAQRNIVLTFKEVLSHIEKHVHAQRVDIGIKWKKTYLELEVKADGNRYDPALMPPQSFGFELVQDGVLEKGAPLTIAFKPARGTGLSLRVLYEEEI